MGEQAEMEDMIEEVKTRYGLLEQFEVQIQSDEQIQREALQPEDQDLACTRLEAKAIGGEQQESTVEGNFTRNQDAEDKIETLVGDMAAKSFTDSKRIPSAWKVLEELEKIVQQQLRPDEDARKRYGHCPPQKLELTELQAVKTLFNEKEKLGKPVDHRQESACQWNTGYL